MSGKTKDSARWHVRLRERPWSAIRNVAAPPDAALVRSLVELALEDSFDEQLDGRRVEYARGKVAELGGEDVAGIAIETAIIAVMIAVDATNADRRGPGKARKVIRRVQADHATIEAMTDAETAIDADPEGEPT
jgi:hypothetical protein